MRRFEETDGRHGGAARVESMDRGLGDGVFVAGPGGNQIGHIDGEGIVEEFVESGRVAGVGMRGEGFGGGGSAVGKSEWTHWRADASADGPAWIDRRIAEALDVSVRMVEELRKSYVLEGFEATLERKKQCRPSRQPVLDGAQEARLVALCCGTVPAGHGRWTLRLLADKLVELNVVERISHETVREVLKKTNCSLGGG